MRKTLYIGLLTMILIFAMVPQVVAHELFIEIASDYLTEEIRIDIKWGHIRDFVDQANHERYELFVRYPSGDVSQLQLEGIGVYGRAYLTPPEAGEYLFWATRTPSVYAPEDGQPRLSVHMAKAVYQYGEGPATVHQETALPLEILSHTDLQGFTSGIFEGQLQIHDQFVVGATITAYGPDGQLLETESGPEGLFELYLDTMGVWLVKANVNLAEVGELDGAAYAFESLTSTLLIDTFVPDYTIDHGGSERSDNVWIMVILFAIGLLLGGSGGLVIAKKRSKHNA
jgi:hypothetical protein